MSFFCDDDKKQPAESTIEVELIDEKTTKGNLPYLTPLEHLFDEFKWLNRKIAIQVLQLRSAHFYEELKGFRHLFITDKEVDELLSESYSDKGRQYDEILNKKIFKLQQLAQKKREYIDRRLHISIENNQALPIVQVKKLFNLSMFDMEVLIICIAPFIDARYERLYAYLQNDMNKKSPSRDLIVGMLMDDEKSRADYISTFNKTSPLIYYDLISKCRDEPESYYINDQFQVDTRIVQYVLIDQTVDEQLTGKLRLFQPLSWEQVVVGDQFRIRLQKFMTCEYSNYGNVCLYMYGNAGVGKKSIARALCGDLQVLFAVVDVRVLLHERENLEQNVKRVMREGVLQPCAVCFDHIEDLVRQEAEMPGIIIKFLQLLQDIGWLTFLCGDSVLPSAFLEMPRIYTVEIKRPAFVEQISLWKLYLDKVSVDCDLIDIPKVAARFDLSGRQIMRSIREAEDIAYIRDPENSRITYNDLVKSCRLQSQPKLMSLAKKIEPQYCMHDLVLPEDQMAQLQEMTNQVKHQHKILDEWGFAQKISLGRGISTLFSGASGTGKTMAAEVIGNELNLDIYKIDLSTMVSKYIGETEKNLNRLFTEAEHSNSILFFDEADALFGKRSEVKDAHDRFANIEVSYLLQKMEEYEGITILSTNYKKNIDTAFVRRIQFIVDFPVPNEEQREKIWRQIFPSQAPLGNDVDFPLLANTFKITGGNIKNIGIRSAYMAAHENCSISMRHILQSTKRELQKVGIVISDMNF